MDLADTTPVFSAIVSPSAGHAITKLQVQVSTDPEFGEVSIMWDSGWLTLGEAIGPTAADRTEDVTYAQT